MMLKICLCILALHHANQNDFSSAATLAEDFLNSGGYEAQGQRLSIAAAQLMATDWARMATCDEVARRLGLRALAVWPRRQVFSCRLRWVCKL